MSTEHQKLQQIADSPLVRVISYLLTGIVLPMIVFMTSQVMNKVERIEQAQQAMTSERATIELRLQQIERGNNERDMAIRLLTEKTIKHDYEIAAVHGPPPSPPRLR